MKKEYKKLIIYIIRNINSFKFYSYFIDEIMENQNSSLKEKYKLIKLYYKFNIVQSLYYSQDKKESINPIINFFKKGKKIKKDNYSEKDLLKDYQNYLIKLIEMSDSTTQKDETSLELLKVLFILLINELKTIIPLNVYTEINNFSNIKNLLFKSEDILKI